MLTFCRNIHRICKIDSKIDSGVCILEQCSADLNVKFDVDFIVCGDMNARTKNYVPHLNDPARQIFNYDNMYPPLRVNIRGRRNNSCGEMLLELYTTFILQILNCVCKADSKGHFTFESEAGCSLVDCFMVSSCLFNYFTEVMEMKVSEKIDSTYMPLELNIKKSLTVKLLIKKAKTVTI